MPRQNVSPTNCISFVSFRFSTSCFVPGYAEPSITKKPRPPYYGKRQPLGSKIPNSTTLSLCPMTSFAKKMRPGIDDSSRSCQPHHGALLWAGERRFRWRLTSAKEVFHVRQTALWASSICVFHILPSPVPRLSPFAPMRRPPWKFQGLFLSSFDTKKRKGLVTNVSSGVVSGLFARI